jgi:GT2 family glycosyltransferase
MIGTLSSKSSDRCAAPTTDGKFLSVNGETFFVRGVAYGSFAPRADGHQFPGIDRVRRDFDLMRHAGINTVRTYTVPPLDVLDAAAERALRVMVGLTWPQHVAFLDDRRLRRGILRTIGTQTRSVAIHPALLLIAIGNEIPPGVVRWHGRRRVETFIRDAFDAARSAAPHVLLTYVNYPPTEFLELPFLDVHAFNVYLHDEATMRAYVARLQHIAADRPLLLTECGADSLRESEAGQANLAAMQVRVAFTEGACGAVVFGWTDEWWRSGASIDDWAFGLVNAQRQPKPAYHAVARTFAEVPFHDEAKQQWPSVSVVVCAYNAASTIDDCLESLERVHYTALEIIVVDDGSTDDTAARASAHRGVRLIRVDNGGLSAARNIGLHAATGDIVAYVDADVRVDPLWLTYLVQPFGASNVVAAGGPNVVPADDHWFAQCVARAPGAPSHVLFDDRIAEHIPGCNFAVRRSALLAIGGFDRIFVRAGDDVDVCWRLQERGGLIAFSPAALVWHHHRGQLTAYWRQQVGYGEGEAWLRLRHQNRFCRSGVAWRGRIYSGLPFVQSMTRRKLHSGVWGTASFPTVYHMGSHPMQAVPHTPEWLLASLLLLLGGFIPIVSEGRETLAMLAAAAGSLGVAITVVKCALYARRSDIERLPPLVGRGRTFSRLAYRLTIAGLHIVQPFARSFGYLRGILRSPESTSRSITLALVPAASEQTAARVNIARLLAKGGQYGFWSETWASGEMLLAHLVERLGAIAVGRQVHVDDGWHDDRDISISIGPWAWAHVRVLVEDHGRGRCLFRTRVYIRPRLATSVVFALALAAILLAAAHGWPRTAIAGGLLGMVLGGLRTAQLAARNAREIVRVVATVAREHGMRPVALRAKRRVTRNDSRWSGHLPRPEPTHGA